MSDILSGFTSGYSVHHKHIAKQYNIESVIKYKSNNIEVVRFLIDGVKKGIVIWAEDMKEKHGKAIKSDNDHIPTRATISYQHKQTVLEEYGNTMLYPGHYKVKNLDKDTIYRTTPLKYKRAEGQIKKLICGPFQDE
eukprot:382900-Ditylum_brightwellii.AAC.1